MAGRKKSSGPRRPKYGREAMLMAWAEKLSATQLASCRVDPTDAVVVVEKSRGALAQMRLGKATQTQVTDLVAQHGMAVVMCEANCFGSMAYADDVDAAGRAIHEAGARAQVTGVWRVSDEEAAAIEVLIDLREEMLSHEENTIGLERRAMDAAMEAVRQDRCLAPIRRKEFVDA